jgi:hypothetical protein
MIVAGHGQIAQLQIPPDWVESTPDAPLGSSGGRGDREFHPPGRTDVTLCLYYRGAPIDPSSAEEFSAVLSKTAHVLSDEEIDTLFDVLGNAANPNAFDMRYARTIDLRGKTVLAVEGVWTELKIEGLHFYVDADGSGRFVQEIYFTAPRADFDGYGESVKAALASVEWADAAV